MGGVPFSSTGCNTCRRRKVKCDETKPKCLRCVKYGHVCTGYGRKRVFVHKSTDSMCEKTDKLDYRLNETTEETIKSQELIRANNAVPSINTNAETRVQLLTSFINEYLPSSYYLKDETGKNLLHTLPGVIGDSSLLDKAIVSLSSAFLAKQNNDDHLLHYSTDLYTNAMRQLRKKILSGDNYGKDLLYTTVLFQIYELINCSPSGFMAWIAHVQGSNAIINQCVGREEDAHMEKLFLRQLKFVTVCDAIGKREAANFSQSNPWHDDSSHGTATSEPIDEVIDLMSECSVLLGKVDHFIQNETPTIEVHWQYGQQLLDSCLSLETKLHRFYMVMQHKLGMPSALDPNNLLEDAINDAAFKDLFSNALKFPSLTCAEAHLIYWATLVLLYPLIDQLHHKLEPSRSKSAWSKFARFHEKREGPEIYTNSQPLMNFTALAEHYADEICRSVAYCIQPDMKTLGPQLLLAPLSQSTQFYVVHDSIDKYEWCRSVFRRLPRIGLGIASLLGDMVWPKYESAHRRKSLVANAGDIAVLTPH